MRTLALALMIAGVLGACEGAREQPPVGTAAPSGPPLFRVKTDASPVANPGMSAGDRVFFAFDSAVLEPPMIAVLQRQAEWMRVHPDGLFVLAGHADERGTREYNLALGARRAAAVRDELAALGIAPDRFKLTSYGKERPAVVGSTEAAWSLNRRVETLIDE